MTIARRKEYKNVLKRTGEISFGDANIVCRRSAQPIGQPQSLQSVYLFSLDSLFNSHYSAKAIRAKLA